jgi:hypothetical protein
MRSPRDKSHISEGRAKTVIRKVLMPRRSILLLIGLDKLAPKKANVLRRGLCLGICILASIEDREDKAEIKIGIRQLASWQKSHGLPKHLLAHTFPDPRLGNYPYGYVILVKYSQQYSHFMHCHPKYWKRVFVQVKLW